MTAPPDLAIALPELMRFEDRTQTENDRCYAACRAREDGLADGSGRMSRLTEALLRRISIAWAQGRSGSPDVLGMRKCTRWETAQILFKPLRYSLLCSAW
jgi:hypothetical protein